MAHITKCASIILKSISKVLFVLLVAINSQGAAENYGLLFNTECIFNMPCIIKCASIVVESVSEVLVAFLMPINSQGAAESYSLLSDNECIFKIAHSMK